MDLDPIYKDALGRPLISLTYNGTDNDHAMSRYVVGKLESVIKATDPTHYEVRYRPKNFTIVPYQSTHNTGGTIAGADPKSSVVNRYLQAWDAHNLFIHEKYLRVPAAARLQSNRHAGRSGLFVGQGDH